MNAAKRTMRVLSSDGVELTNNKDVTVVLSMTYDANWKAMVAMASLMMSENTEAAEFMSVRALPWVYGLILRALRNILQDDSDALVAGATAMHESGISPDAKLGLCTWHGFYKRESTETAKWTDQERTVGLGTTAQLSFLNKYGETPEDVQAGLACIKRYIERSVDAGDISDGQGQALIRGVPGGPNANGVVGYASTKAGYFFPGASKGAYFAAIPCV